MVEEPDLSQSDPEEEVERRLNRRTVLPPSKRPRVMAMTTRRPNMQRRKRFSCPQCDSFFEWAEHLDSHISSAHGRRARTVATQRPR